MIHPIKFARWARDAGWRDTLAVLRYPFQTWRCQLFGHQWGPEQTESEWAGYPITVSRYHDCQREHCVAWNETWNIYDENRKAAA